MTDKKVLKVPTKPETYSGLGDPAAFIQIFDIACEANNWDEKVAPTQFPVYLRDSAFNWYIQKTKERKRENLKDWTWEELKTAFLADNGTPDKRSSMSQYTILNKMQQAHETASTYFVDMDLLCSRVDPDMSAPARIKTIIRGLLPSYRKDAYMKNFTKTTELHEFLKMLDEANLLAKQNTSDSYDGDILVNTIKVPNTPTQVNSHEEPTNDLEHIERRLNRLEVLNARTSRQPDRRPIHNNDYRPPNFQNQYQNRPRNYYQPRYQQAYYPRGNQQFNPQHNPYYQYDNQNYGYNEQYNQMPPNNYYRPRNSRPFNPNSNRGRNQSQGGNQNVSGNRNASSNSNQRENQQRPPTPIAQNE